MMLSELICEKFIFIKYENGKLQFWSEDACGYVEDITNAGVFEEPDRKKFALRCFDSHGIKTKEYKRFIHFAVTVSNAIKYFM